MRSDLNLDGDAVLLFGFKSDLRNVQNTRTHMNLPVSGGEIDENSQITPKFNAIS